MEVNLLICYAGKKLFFMICLLLLNLRKMEALDNVLN